MTDVIIVGGGAAGFFTAINIAEQNSNLSILILERSKQVLQKVRVSGGGRCNVTHAEFIPNELVKNYPRGERELRGPFHTFMTGDTMEWFAMRGVELKIEEDGRIFPTTNSSETIIQCFLELAQKLGIRIETSTAIVDFQPVNEQWKLTSKNNNTYTCKQLVVATGSQQKTWDFFKNFGISTVAPVPSLFTLKTSNKDIVKLAGISQNVSLQLKDVKLQTEGPLLITHKGFSGPAILKLSAWGAQHLHSLNYQFTLQINWTGYENFKSCLSLLQGLKTENPKLAIGKQGPFAISKRLWHFILNRAGLALDTAWGMTSKKMLGFLSNELTNAFFDINGKNTFKEEFVTAGGIDLKEIDFKTYRSKKLPNCYFVGEVLNIDAITGGFNFQNAWTGGFIAAKHIALIKN